MTENTLSVDFGEMTRAKSVPILSKQPDISDEDEDGVVSCHGNGSGDGNGRVELEYEKTEADRNGDSVKFKVGASGDSDNCLEEKETRLRSQSSVESVRVQAVDKLQAELKKAQEALQLKDEQVNKLSSIRDEMDKELEELTASLFQEAHGMVREANIKRAASEKQRKEAVSKIEVLQAEVHALKALVITSTPSIHYRKSRLGFHRSVSHHPKQPFTPTHQKASSMSGLAQIQSKGKTIDNREINPELWKDFMMWKSEISLSRDSKFMARILQEDIRPCLNFANAELASGLLNSVETNTLSMEPIMTSSYPKKCALTGAKKVCKYRFRLSETQEWHNITSTCRERVTVVCDFYTYLRYIQQGLVKAEEKDMYWEIIRHRCEMSMAKLGV
ncbi:rab-3A-interacting protein-like [Glandiceps talaboti]